MEYFDLMVRKELLMLKVVNCACRLIDAFKFRQNQIVRECMDKAVNAKGKENTAVIILNAPSVKKQDLTVLSKFDLVFVNRGFLHPDYKVLHPKYHIICDPKFRTGVWPITWVDEILAMVPDITFVLPIEWRDVPALSRLKNSNIKICWMRLKDKPYSPFVAGYAIQFLMSLKYETIYFTGCEANGIGHELVKDTSHFYGTNSENSIKTSDDYIMDFYMYFCNYSYFKKIAKISAKKGVCIINLTIGGCLDMFKREVFPMLNITEVSAKQKP